MAKNIEIKKTSFDDLPEHIKQHILSFLPEKDATKTCILSKEWLSAWRTKPTLDFDSEQIFFQNLDINGMGSKDIEERQKKFSKYVKRTLKRYTQQKIRIETLKLDSGRYAHYLPVNSVLVERCTRVAVERGVKNLHLFGKMCDDLPQIIVGAKSLVDLSIRGLNMLHLSTEKIMWHSLKRLCLEFLYIDEVMFDNIISSCPLLEILKIFNSSDNVHVQYQLQFKFKVIDHHNLKQLDVSLFVGQKLIVSEAPKLESFICYHQDQSATNGVSLLSSQYQNLKELTLSSGGITEDFFNNLEQKFPHLQDLSVQYCKHLRRIKISSPSLQRIQLVKNSKLEEAHFDVPSIELLDYICGDYCKIMPEFSFSSVAKGDWISILRIDWRRNFESCWFLKLKKFLVNLIPSKIFLNIAIDKIDGSKELLDRNEVRNSLTFGEPQELQELSLSLSPRLRSSSTLSALDCLFLICRPKIISQYWVSGFGYNTFTKLCFDMIMLRTNEDEHQKLQQITSWQHDLIRQVKFQIYESDYSRSVLALERPEALDWESILKACKEEYKLAGYVLSK